MKKNNIIIIENLHVEKDSKKILTGLSLRIHPGRVTAIMGPNGSGKSTLSNVLMGNSTYTVTKGKITWQGKNLLTLTPDERAKLGLFLSFQNPVEIPGVNTYDFLLTAYGKLSPGIKKHEEFDARLQEAKKSLGVSDKMLERSLHEGFSGGEKKRLEVLELMLFRPRISILDEVDSGLDVDALKNIAKNILSMRKKGAGFLVITHYQRLLNYLPPDEVHVLKDGKIVASGGRELVKKIESKGYAGI